LSTSPGRLDELDRMLASGEATRDMDEYRKLTREHAELGPVVALYQEWQQAEADLRRRRKCWPIRR
jgi:peptide chain release factor 1